jgi:hypothetical protein
MNKLPKLVLVLLFALFSIGLQAQQPERFMQDGKYGFKNAKGKVVVKPKYEVAFHFREDGRALVKAENGKYGYINKKGKFVVKPTMDEAEVIAAKFCDCGPPVLEMKKKMDAASREEKLAIAGEAMKAAGEMMDCIGGKEALKKLEDGKTEAQKKKFEDDLKAAVEKQCPELVELVE